MSVTAARGWRASGVRAGTKPSGDLDLALVVSDQPAAVAGAFTTNRARSAHIHVCAPRVASGRSAGVVVSAGIANACTGRPGIDDALAMASRAAQEAGVADEDMLICSTGTIGGRIPLHAVLPAMAEAAKTLSPDGGDDAARAIMTTDTRPKTATATLSGGAVVGGMAKGAGMIAPGMQVEPHATMLAFLTTDVVAPATLLREILATGLEPSFNSITVDGSMSTNDTVLLFANGASGVEPSGDELAEAVHSVMRDLAYAIVSDGEGCTKVVRISVSGAGSAGEARIAARAVADSVLFRAAIWGGDPNWGRVVQSLGQCSAAFDPDTVGVSIGGVRVAHDGIGTGREAEAAAALTAPEVSVAVELGQGDAEAEILTCDLTPDYVRFNADYTT